MPGDRRAERRAAALVAARAFGERVRGAREAKGWTQEDLAEATGFAVVQVSRIERGVREVRLTTVLKLLVALDLTPDELLGGLELR